MTSVFKISPMILAPRPFLLAVLQGWRKYTAEARLQVYKAEVCRLQSSESKKTSIWHMSKADLVETARAELGYSVMTAQALTTTELRERIRSRREGLKLLEDPLNSLPKGLDKTNKQECQMWN